MKKLHLGCGSVILPGYTNIDLYNDKADLQQDVSKLNFADKSVDLIYACHILEHFNRNEYFNILTEWVRVLKIGGKIRLSVPSFESIVEHYTKHHNIDLLQGLLNGGQTDKWNHHNTMFDKNKLTNDFKKLKCHNVKEWDWRRTSHAEFDDFSQAYLPHMDKDNGILMSLNLEATRWK